MGTSKKTIGEKCLTLLPTDESKEKLKKGGVKSEV